jgi:2,3-bisphosphoglycerate-dependent phosphoglycerate mutase
VVLIESLMSQERVAVSSLTNLVDVSSPRHDSSITLVRHGESTWNVLGLIQGQNDVAQLTAVGRDQARAVAESLKSMGFDRMVTSDLARACQTAEIIGSELDLVATPDSLLRERCFGVLEGEPQDMLDSESSGILDGVFVDPDAHPQGGESFRDVVTRVGIFIEATLDFLGGERLLVVTHGGTIRALRAYVEALPLEGLETLTVGNCSVWDLYPTSLN